MSQRRWFAGSLILFLSAAWGQERQAPRLLWEQQLSNGKHSSAKLLPANIQDAASIVIANSNNEMWSLDASTGKVKWTRSFAIDDGVRTEGKQHCSDRLAAAPAVFGQEIYMLAADGMLRIINASDGLQKTRPMPFLPNGVAAQQIIVTNEAVFAASTANCAEPATIWRLDRADPSTDPRFFKLGANAAGVAPLAEGIDGTIYVQTDDGPWDPPHSQYGGGILAFSKDLKLSQYFILPLAENLKFPAKTAATSPTVINYKDKSIVAVEHKDGRLYLLKAEEVGGNDHHHYLARSIPIPASDNDSTHGFVGQPKLWKGPDGASYIVVAIRGPLSYEMHTEIPTAQAKTGSIVGFRIEEKDGVPVLRSAWVSQNLDSPMTPQTTEDCVLAFAYAKPEHEAKKNKREHSHVTAFALDGSTGKELYSSEDTNTSGKGVLVVSDDQAALLTTDTSDVYAFGLTAGDAKTRRASASR